MALSSRSQLYHRTGSFCTGLAQRQGGCRCWIDALLQQWASRGPGPQAQIGQALDVWPRQTASVTSALAQCRLSWAAKRLREDGCDEWYQCGMESRMPRSE